MKILLSILLLFIGSSIYAQYGFESDLFEFSNEDSLIYRENRIIECATYIHYYNDGEFIFKNLVDKEIISQEGLIVYLITINIDDTSITDTTWVKYDSSNRIKIVEHYSESISLKYKDTYEYNDKGQLVKAFCYSFRENGILELEESNIISYSLGKPYCIININGDTTYNISFANDTVIVERLNTINSSIVKYFNNIEVLKQKKQDITKTIYNKVDKPLKIVTRNIVGNILETTLFEYNQFNLIESFTIINAEGKITHKQEYLYKTEN